MIRKKKNNEKKEEMLKREKELQMQIEKDKQRKEKQKTLTENLRKTYSHIKPTIIQGQRILKVIEEMTKKIQFIKFINSSLIESLTKKDLIQLSNKNQKFYEDLQTKEQSFFEIKELITQKLQEFNAYNDDESIDLSNVDDLDLNDDQREILEKIEEYEYQLSQKTLEIKAVIKKLQQEIYSNESDQRIIKGLLNQVENITKLDDDVIDCAVSIKYLFLKKLSTGYDEEETHKQMLTKLDKNIKDNKELLQKSEISLQQIIENRQKMNSEKNQEINNLKDELNSLKQSETEKLQEIQDDSNKRLEQMKYLHEEKKKNLTQIIYKIKNDLLEVEKTNNEKESKLNKQNEDNRKRQENSLGEYDNEIREATLNYEKQFEEYQQILQQIKICEEKCKKLKYKKKINKQFIDEWNDKLNTISIENQKKENAAQMIINVWKFIKQKSKKKSKKKKKKNK